MIDCLAEPFGKYGLSYSQLVAYDVERKSDVVVTRLGHESGEWIDSVMPIKPMAMVIDKSTKETAVTMQSVGSAITYARRYALMAIAGVAPDNEDDDGNAASYVGPPPTATRTAPPTAPPPPKAPPAATPAPPPEPDPKISAGQKGQLVTLVKKSYDDFSAPEVDAMLLFAFQRKFYQDNKKLKWDDVRAKHAASLITSISDPDNMGKLFDSWQESLKK